MQNTRTANKKRFWCYPDFTGNKEKFERNIEQIKKIKEDPYKTNYCNPLACVLVRFGYSRSRLQFS